MGSDARCHRILGPFGPVKIKAGQPVDEEMQERLDDLCK